tara:strand:- start:44 stop:676 length:633 start_codon:yes stop_codon:yes gene_type:complete
MVESVKMKPDAPLLETRSSLIQRLKATINGQSWEEFFQTYWQLIYNVARRSGLSEVDSQDVVQETILKVHNSMEKFEYNRKRGSFKGWLRTVTRSRLAEYFKKQQRRPGTSRPVDNSGEVLNSMADPEGPELEKIWDEEWQRNLIQAALTRTKKLTSPKQFQIFKCHYIDGWTVKETCKTLGVNAAQIYMAKQRVGKIFKDSIESIQEQS